jgi:ubiquinone/menaquinone biosynthesis C-methylase UbiE
VSPYDPLAPDEWARFLKKQAEHTKEERHDLYEKVELKERKKILEVGCGTGAITTDIASLTTGHITAIDINKGRFEKARSAASSLPCVTFAMADVMGLPFKDDTFDLVVSSVVLLYVKDKQRAVNEMARVTQKNGAVLATMEPDHSGWLNYPENRLAPLFMKDLEEMGADTRMGRKLKYLFSKSGLKTEIGISAYWSDMNQESDELLRDFLDRFWIFERIFRRNGWTDNEIEEYKQEQITLIREEVWFSFLPVFYAIGRKE